jgi:D-sedoheptulose 7-phosphate isomerase
MLWQEIVQDHSTLLEAVKLDSYLTQTLLEIADAITNALSTNRRVLLFGNGGSAADAQHLAAEFIGRFQKERCAWDVEALTVNTSILTAVANDYGFEVVFARQIQAIVRPKDVVIGLSTSGRSKNVAAALHAAKQQGGITVLMTGRNGFCDDADLTLNIPSDNTARIQEMHILAGHFLAQAVELRLTQ